MKYTFLPSVTGEGVAGLFRGTFRPDAPSFLRHNSLPVRASKHIARRSLLSLSVELTKTLPLAITGVDPEFAHQIMAFIEQYRPALEDLAK